MPDDDVLWLLAGLLVLGILLPSWRAGRAIRALHNESRPREALNRQTNQTPRTPRPQQRVLPSPPPREAKSPGTEPGVNSPPRDSHVGRIVSRTIDRHGQHPLVDNFALHGEQPLTPAVATEVSRLYQQGMTISEVAWQAQQDQKQVALHPIREYFYPRPPLDDDDNQARARKKYDAAEIETIVNMFKRGASLPDIADDVNRSQLGVGWRLLDLGHPRRRHQ